MVQLFYILGLTKHYPPSTLDLPARLKQQPHGLSDLPHPTLLLFFLNSVFSETHGRAFSGPSIYPETISTMEIQ